MSVGEKHFVGLLPVVEGDRLGSDEVVIDGEVRRVRVGHRGLQVGCHYITDDAFKKIRSLYLKVRGGEE